MKIVVAQASDPDFDSLFKVEMVDDFEDPEQLDLLAKFKSVTEALSVDSAWGDWLESFSEWGLTVYDFLTRAMEMETLPEPFRQAGIASISAVECDLIFPQDTFVVGPE